MMHANDPSDDPSYDPSEDSDGDLELNLATQFYQKQMDDTIADEKNEKKQLALC
jgi:hypothetical protein